MDRENALLQAQELQLQASARMAPVLFHGKSMLPFFNDNDELWAEPVEWQDIQPGDIITYRMSSRFPTCRVIVKQKDHLVLSADNWGSSNYEAWREDVLGKIVARRRNGQTLRHTDSEWIRYTSSVLLRQRTKRTVTLWRGRLKRRGNKVRDRWVAWHEGYHDLPAHIHVNVSSRCNLRCRMCPYLHLHTDPTIQRYMTRDLFARLLPVISQVNSVGFVGAGEPLFNKELVHFMEMTRTAAPSAQIDLTTNATMLTGEFAQHLIRLGVHKVHLSFDGLNPETVESIRRGVSYSRVLQNIRTLAELKEQQNSTYPILMINYMMGYGTYREFADFIPLARELGVREIQLLEMQPSTAEDYADNMFHNLNLDQGRILREALKQASHAGIHLHLPGIVPNACYHPATPHIGEDGEVYPCCYLDYGGRQLYSEGEAVQMPVIWYGNINTRSFREIWNSPEYVGFRRKTAAGDFPDYCRTCYNVRNETAVRVQEVLGPR